jgi:hypothetical protein
VTLEVKPLTGETEDALAELFRERRKACAVVGRYLRR